MHRALRDAYNLGWKLGAVLTDRAPDATVDGVRLFDAFRGPHWTLLALGTDAPAAPVAQVVTGSTPATYGTGLFLVRPDGYIGWASTTPGGLDAYMRRFGPTG
ncbi:aromatic-ring hydroxylase C-terminal domain-containing protein [Streptomyces sp. NPDC001665]